MWVLRYRSRWIVVRSCAGWATERMVGNRLSRGRGLATESALGAPRHWKSFVLDCCHLVLAPGLYQESGMVAYRDNGGRGRRRRAGTSTALSQVGHPTLQDICVECRRVPQTERGYSSNREKRGVHGFSDTDARSQTHFPRARRRECQSEYRYVVCTRPSAWRNSLLVGNCAVEQNGTSPNLGLSHFSQLARGLSFS